ncbi:hypothetical protein HO173_005181 [Letharia columbiana]|uniref:Uncharacterized protein n=1 Tax=Letharia columbiana TaxID=112416 RepID=A0A8H6L5Z5_9LECA|nr:uncharacterized protein HO173_005181 [Letharia columbiana]KAF6236890.1 hypothetical protein HO173_005181 [Letharia columbiana]
MKFQWLLSIFSLLGLPAARGWPVIPVSSTGPNPSTVVLGASTISAAASLTWTENVSTNSTLHKFFSFNGSTKATNVNGPVTVLKTIELIPRPLLSDSSAGAREPAKNLTRDGSPLATIAQQATVPTVSPPAKPRSSSEPSISSSPQGAGLQLVGQSVKRSMLQPIIVGGITYAPVHAHHTRSSAGIWQGKSRASLANSETVEWHGYYAKHDSEPNGLDHENLKSVQGQGGLPPVVVGGLTYRPVGEELESGRQTPAPVNVAGSATETAKPAANPLVEGGTMSRLEQSEPTAAKSPYPASPGGSSRVSMQSQIPPSPPGSSILVLGSQTLTAVPGSSGFILGSGSLLPGSPAITVDGTADSLDPSATLNVGNSTVILAASGALTIANETFVPLGSTAISVKGTTLSISGPAMTNQGTLLSLAPSGLVVDASTFPFATPTPTAAVTTTNQASAPPPPFAISGHSIIPASPSTFTIAGETFTAYPGGLAIDGTEVFQGSTAITVSGTAISLGSSDLVVGTSTVPFASVTGLGPALASGLDTVAGASGGGVGPDATSTSAKGSHRSAAGQLKMRNLTAMVWLAIVALITSVV